EHDPKRASGAAGRQFLAAALPGHHPALGRVAGAVSGQPGSQATGSTRMINRFVQVEWSGILVAILAGMLALSVVSPAFLTEFNLFVLLRSFCVVLLVAYAQMVTLGVGQMNLAIGSLGGL